jgi:hypothetical protein
MIIDHCYALSRVHPQGKRPARSGARDWRDGPVSPAEVTAHRPFDKIEHVCYTLGHDALQHLIKPVCAQPHGHRHRLSCPRQPAIRLPLFLRNEPIFHNCVSSPCPPAQRLEGSERPQSRETWPMPVNLLPGSATALLSSRAVAKSDDWNNPAACEPPLLSSERAGLPRPAVPQGPVGYWADFATAVVVQQGCCKVR